MRDATRVPTLTCVDIREIDRDDEVLVSRHWEIGKLADRVFGDTVIKTEFPRDVDANDRVLGAELSGAISRARIYDGAPEGSEFDELAELHDPEPGEGTVMRIAHGFSHSPTTMIARSTSVSTSAIQGRARGPFEGPAAIARTGSGDQSSTRSTTQRDRGGRTSSRWKRSPAR